MADREGVVVIVPGFGGSELYSGLPATVFHRLWLSPAVLLAGGWHWLELSADGVTAPLPIPFNLQPGPPLSAYYGTLAAELARRGWRVMSPLADWRQSLTFDAAGLVNLLLRNLEDAPLHLVVHSRGGLVARAALARLNDLGQLGAVGRVVGLGVPHEGSLGAAAILGGWEATVALLYLLLEVGPRVLQGGYPRQELLRIVDTWPSVYELLPMPGASWIGNDDVAAIYNPLTWQLQALPISTRWLAAGRERWELLPPVPSLADWYDFAGTGILTPDRISSTALIRFPFGFGYSLSGDGQVTTASALHRAGPAVYCPTGHGALIYDGRVIDQVDAVLMNGLSEDVIIPGSVLAGQSLQ